MRVLVSFVAVLVLALVAYLGTGILGLEVVFGTILPYLAILLFLGGIVYRVLVWAKVPVPFRIPTTCGQQQSLSWIRSSPLENPPGKLAVIGRMALEVLMFRSLGRNTTTEVTPDGRVIHSSSRWLWAAALAFHWCFLIVLLRHLRFFTEPVAVWVSWIANLDGFLQIGVPTVYITSVVLLASLAYLFLRRIYSFQLRYISLPTDYFPLFLLLGITVTGILMRHVIRADITEAKAVAIGLVSLKPIAPSGIHWIFYVHVFFVSVLLAYFPFSKLMHMGGVFLSPTRNMANSNRRVRHVNPWDYPVKVHTYQEYEDEFRDKMKGAGIPVEKE